MDNQHRKIAGYRELTTVWDVEAVRNGWMVARTEGGIDERQDHSTQKPAELYLRAINNHTEFGDLVYEPFAGSGTAVVACEQSGRACRALELEPRCVDVVLRRWRKFTGEEPTREGRTLASLELEAEAAP